MFGSLSVNAAPASAAPSRAAAAGRRRIAGAAASGAPERRIELPRRRSRTGRSAWCWVRRTTNSATRQKKLFLDSEWKISATSDRMGYRLEGPVIKHLHGHNIVSDGTVNGSIQVPGNGAPIVLMPDRGTSGGYPKIATVISADFGRFAQIPAGNGFRFKAVGMAKRKGAARNFAAIAARPARPAARHREILISTSKRCKMLMSPAVAVSAVDAGTWHYAVHAGRLTRSAGSTATHRGATTMKTVDLNCDLGEGFGAWEMGNDAAMIELATSRQRRLRLPCRRRRHHAQDRGARESARRQRRRASRLPRPARLWTPAVPGIEGARDREPGRLSDRRVAGDRDRRPATR